jgi:nitrate reductase gamma subunit
VTHSLLKQYIFAICISALVSPFAFALASYLFADTPHEIEMQIFIFFACVSLGVAALIGLPFLFWRRYATKSMRRAQ